MVLYALVAQRSCRSLLSFLPRPVLCGYEYSPAGPMERLRPMYYQDINPMDRAPTLEMRSLRLDPTFLRVCGSCLSTPLVFI
eukprot:2542004-Amphidinium_carterae.1